MEICGNDAGMANFVLCFSLNSSFLLFNNPSYTPCWIQFLWIRK